MTTPTDPASGTNPTAPVGPGRILLGLNTFGDVGVFPDGHPVPHAQVLRQLLERTDRQSRASTGLRHDVLRLGFELVDAAQSAHAATGAADSGRLDAALAIDDLLPRPLVVGFERVRLAQSDAISGA